MKKIFLLSAAAVHLQLFGMLIPEGQLNGFLKKGDPIEHIRYVEDKVLEFIGSRAAYTIPTSARFFNPIESPLVLTRKGVLSYWYASIRHYFSPGEQLRIALHYGDNKRAWALLNSVNLVDSPRYVLGKVSAGKLEKSYVDTFVEVLNLRKKDDEQRFLEDDQEKKERMSKALLEMLLRVVERVPTVSLLTDHLESHRIVRPEALGALLWALDEGNVEVLERVLLHRVDVNTKKAPFNETSALVKATRFSLKNVMIAQEMVDQLLNAGAKIDQKVIVEVEKIQIMYPENFGRLRQLCGEQGVTGLSIQVGIDQSHDTV